MRLTIKKGDIWMVLVVLLFSAFSFFWISTRKTGGVVCVSVDGTTREYPLSENRELVLDRGDGSNTVVIMDGSVFMKSASCPDQICVRHRKISKEGEVIICLPNQVYVSVKSGEKSEFDN